MQTSNGCVWNWEMLGFWICNGKYNSRCIKFKEHLYLKSKAMFEKVSYVWFDQGHTSWPWQYEGKKSAILIASLIRYVHFWKTVIKHLRKENPIVHYRLWNTYPWGRTQSLKYFTFGERKQKPRTKSWFCGLCFERRLTEQSIQIAKIFPAPDQTQKQLSHHR